MCKSSSFEADLPVRYDGLFESFQKIVAQREEQHKELLDLGEQERNARMRYSRICVALKYWSGILAELC